MSATPLATRPFVALFATLAIQVYVSLVASAVSVLAPVIAPALALSETLVGVFIGLVYAAAMTASLVSGVFILRYGAIRVSQASVLLAALGMAMLPLAGGSIFALALLIAAALIIGAGYGPITPASSQVLAQTAPPSRMALTFSIKQTGVPGGAALAGAVLPALALSIGWKATLWLLAATGIAVLLAAQPMRADLDRARDRSRRFTVAGMLKPLRKVLRDPRLAELTIMSFFYAALQVSLMTFLVVYLTQALGWSLVAAGLALTLTTVGGVAGRVLWGLVADTYVPPRLLLGLLGALGGVCSMAVAAWPATAPVPLFLALCTVFGATAIGWNGVQLAEVARLSPPGEAGAITGATGFIGFSGVVVGPPLFGALASLTGDFRTGFAAMGGAIMVCGVWILVRVRRERRRPH